MLRMGVIVPPVRYLLDTGGNVDLDVKLGF
jgi:hypothetical protein